MNEIHFTKKDFKLEWFSGVGAGGQYRNKHRNCCRITHLETGLKAVGTEHRERPSNQKVAFKRLCNLLMLHYLSMPTARRDTTEVIRNYHAVRNEVHDKASGLKMPYKTVVGCGEIGPMIDARMKACQAG